MVQGHDNGLTRPLSGQAFTQQPVAAVPGISIEVPISGQLGFSSACADSRHHGAGAGLRHVVLTDFGHGRRVATPHAGRAHQAHLTAYRAGKLSEQSPGTGEFAGDAVAHPHSQGRRRRLVLFHHVETGVEGGDLEDFHQSQTHFLSQRRQVDRGKVPVMVLDQMQMLDEQIAPTGPVTQQFLNGGQGGRIHLSAFGGTTGAFPSRTGVAVLGD